MNTLVEDREEMADERERAWVARQRRAYGIRPHDGACWFVEVESSRIDDEPWHDTHMVMLQSSPGDALAFAEAYAGDARRDGIGRWTLEVYGDGVNGPRLLIVRPHWDELA